MRYTTGGVAHMAAVIEDDLQDRDTGLHKPHVKGLADLSASMLACRSVNTSELLSVLPRQTKDADSRYRYIHRWLKNPLIDPLACDGGICAGDFGPIGLWRQDGCSDDGPKQDQRWL